jgi:hypothetical protein
MKNLKAKIAIKGRSGMEKIVRSRRGSPKMRKKNRRSNNNGLERMS